MSRGGYDDFDENFPNEGAFWEKRAQLARKGKRGRKALSELREALLALPEKRLIEGAMSTVRVPERCQRPLERRLAEEKIEQQGKGVCAVGAYIWHQRIKAGMTADEAFDSLPLLFDEGYSTLDDTALAGRDAGLTYTLAWVLADHNDEGYRGCTPEQRYERFMKWLDREIGPPVARTGRCL